jgi:hypothetical protein
MSVGVLRALKGRADKVSYSRDERTVKSVTSGGHCQRLYSDYCVRRIYRACTLTCRPSVVTRFEPCARKLDVCLRVSEGKGQR